MQLTGYVVEKPRVGTANSPYTSSPDNLISNQSAYDTGFGVNEDSPGRTEYLTLVIKDGDIPEATFGWTKNEGGIQRFDFDGAEGKFRTLPGGRLVELGVLTLESNSTRLKASPIPAYNATYSPFRISVGDIGSGVTFTVHLVDLDSNFTVITTSGVVELSLETGNLNWKASDLVFQAGQVVRYQQQTFFTLKESTGYLGVAGVDTIILNPIPGLGFSAGNYQAPLVRLGFGLYLTPIPKATEAAFSANPTQGTFQWARDTGLVRFNSTDLADNEGESVYFDGNLFRIGVQLPRQSLGTVNSPSSIIPVPLEGSDVFFRAVHGSEFQQFPITSKVITLTSPGKTGEVQLDPSGAVRFSNSDKADYGTWNVTAYSGDLYLERGISMRFFRSPVDLSGTNPSVKDFSAFYPTVEARWADPIVGAPMVFMPVTPIDDPAYPMVVDVQQGTGTFVGELPRLDVPNPPAGLGYTLDFEGKQLVYSFRRNLEVAQIPQSTGAWCFQPLISPSNALFELDSGTGFKPLHLVGEPAIVGSNAGDAILEATSGVLTFVDEVGTVLIESSGGVVANPNLSTLVDISVSFSSVQAGNFLVVEAGAAKGVYLVTHVTDTHHLTFNPAFTSHASGVTYTIRQDREVLADRFFSEVALADPNTKAEKVRSLGVCSNSPRLSIPAYQAASSRFRFGENTFSTQVTLVNSDLDFTDPDFILKGSVEISVSSGNLNFASEDLGSDVYWVLKLTQGKDYRISADLGAFQLTERLLAYDELLLTYPSLADNPDTSVTPLVLTTERATFLVRKELTTHPLGTSTIPFNPMGRMVASTPTPQVFRGGRPQSSTQVLINYADSIITFLPDVLPTPTGMTAVTDALPHGPQIGSDERVYIDYYIYNAIGGENTTTVLKAPFVLTPVQIVEGASSLVVKGDRRAEFPANYVLRVDQEYAYYLAAPSYDSVTDLTTVQLSTPQVFRESASNPKLYISSGPLNLTSTFTSLGYFVPDTSTFVSTPRGMNKVRIQGDQSGGYRSGTVLNFSGTLSGKPFSDFFLVSGASYASTTGQTEVVLTSSTPRQYTYGQVSLRRSVRPVYEASTTKAQTSAAPAIPPATSGNPPNSLLDTVLVYRKLEGGVGTILASPLDYTIDDSGAVEFASALAQTEELGIFYTKYRRINPSLIRASYTCTIAPTVDNGLVNQLLAVSFTTYIPDSFYFRVETMTNFRGEVAKQYRDEAKASVPSGGPRVDNASQPKLYEQGRESVFFEEGDLANEDIIARTALLNYHNTVNYLEDILCDIDGRIIGDWDGRFKFDGTLGTTVSSFLLANNQIDDRVKISPFPVVFNPYPTYVGTYIQAYQAGSQSRLYPMKKTGVGKTVTGANDGAEAEDPLLDIEATHLIGSGPTAFRRFPRARVIRGAVEGGTTLYVDSTQELSSPPFRPAFIVGVKVVIQDPSGTYYVTQANALKVTGVTDGTLVFDPYVEDSIPYANTLPNVPVGATVYLANSDTAYQKSYKVGTDVTLDMDKGYLLYAESENPPNKDELLQVKVSMFNTLTTPKKIPALYGSTLDDSGYQRYPLIGPSLDCEVGSGGVNHLIRQSAYVAPGGILAALPTPYVGVGYLDTLRYTIHLLSGTFPTPLPQAGDLVRILDGENGQSPFYRINGATPTSISLETPFPLASTGFQFLVTTSPNLTLGTFTAASGTILTDSDAHFVTQGVPLGATVVVMGGSLDARYQRRQVVEVLSETQLRLDYAFSLTPPVVANYRICTPSSTFSYNDQWAGLVADTLALLGVVSTDTKSEITSAEAFFNNVFTDRFTGLITGTIAGNTFTAGSGVDLNANHVQAGDYLYAPDPQGSAGVYLITEVTSSSTLTLKDTPTSGSVSCRIVTAFGVTEKSLKTIFDVKSSARVFAQKITSWETLVSTPIEVLENGSPNPYYFTRGFLPTSVSAWYAELEQRQTDLSSVIPSIESVLDSGDRLYDKRYTWIDARVNLEKGILVKKQRAISNRIKAQENTLKQLTKILAVE